MEESERRQRQGELKRQLIKSLNIPPIRQMKKLDWEGTHALEDKINTTVEKRLKSDIYNWQPIDYNKRLSMAYLVGRSAQEYAVVYRIFAEIAKRDPNFKPNSYFDFGAGVGTGTWAAAELWKRSLHEYILIDSSADMNDLADLILRNGNEKKEKSLRGVYYRQFLPAASDVSD